MIIIYRMTQRLKPISVYLSHTIFNTWCCINQPIFGYVSSFWVWVQTILENVVPYHGVWCVAWLLAAMILTMQDEQVCIFLQGKDTSWDYILVVFLVHYLALPHKWLAAVWLTNLWGGIKHFKVPCIVAYWAFASHHQTYDTSCTLAGNKIVDHSDVVGASPVIAAPTTSSSSTKFLASMDWAKKTARWYVKYFNAGMWCN